jgi:WD40 repeat protein
LTGVESTRLHNHAADCTTCQELATEAPDEDWRVLVKIPTDALDDHDLLALPVVDPIAFRMAGELSAGGMGRILRGFDRRLGREVAIKEVLDSDPGLRQRFEREAMLTARLQHPAIVPIYEAGTWPDGTPFLTMRLVAGGTLSSAIDGAKALPQRLALLPNVLAAIDAVGYAHARRVIHRDLKPANILVGEFGETVVIDWGLAKELDRELGDPREVAVRSSAATDLTMAGTVFGTPCFMSPEQAAGDELDERDDVYALGAILYHLLAGEPPYWDSSDKLSAQLIVDVTRLRPPTPVAKHVPDAPADLVAIVERAMARDRTQRFPDAGAMATELRRFTAGQLLASREYSLGELIWRWVRRHRTSVTVGVIATAVLAVVVTIAVINVTTSRAKETAARKVAEQARVTSEASLAALLEEQGRIELISGSRERALGYLSESYVRGRDTGALRHLLAAATRDLGLLEHTLESRKIDSTAFRADGRVVLATSGKGVKLEVWHDGKLETTFPIGTRIDDTQLDRGGNLLATVRDNEVSLWDTRTGERRWTASLPYVPMLVFDPTSTHLLAIDHLQAQRSQLVEVSTGSVRSELSVSVADAAFSEDGARVALVGDDRFVRVWMTATGVEVAKFPMSGDGLIRFVGSSNLVSGATGAAEVWRVGELRPSLPLGGHSGDVTAIGASGSGDIILTGDEAGAIRLWTAAGELIAESRAYRGWIRQFVISPDGRLVLVAGSDRRVLVLDRELGVVRALDLDEPATTVAWNQDGTAFLTTTFGAPEVEIWRRPTGNRLLDQRMNGVALGGGSLLVANGRAVSVLDPATGTERSKVASTRTPREWKYWRRDGDLQVSADGRRGIILLSNEVHVFDMSSGALIGMIAVEDGERRLSADGRFVIADRGVERTSARIFDAATGKLVREISAPGGVGLSPDSTLIAGVVDGVPHLWRLATGERVPLPRAAAVPDADAAVFDPTARRICVLGGEHAVIIDATTGAQIATIPMKDGRRRGGLRSRDAVFDNTGKRVAVSAAPTGVVVWDVDAQKQLVAFDDVGSMAWALSHDGARFATGGLHGVVTIWDVATGRLLEELRGHHHAIEGVLFSDDGTRLVTRDDAGHGVVWNVELERRPPGMVVELAKQHGITGESVFGLTGSAR